MTTSTVGTETNREITESHQIYSAPLSHAPDEVVLSQWLNKADGTASYRRVVGIIENIRKTEELTAQAIKEKAFLWVVRAGKWMKPESIDATKPESGEVMTRSEVRAKRRLQRAGVARLVEITQALKRYQFRLSITQLLEPPSSRLISRISCRIRKGDFVLKVGSGDVTRVSEGDVVLAISRLKQRGLLDRVKHCEKCSRWFFAAKAHYRFDKEECRLACYRDNDEYRQRKRIQMREYRDLERRRFSGSNPLRRKRAR